MGYAARNKRRQMTEELKLPEAVRLRLGQLFKAQNDAIGKLPEVHAWQGAAATTMEFLGLDPSGQHHIDFATGIVTPALAPTKPTLVKEEAAS